MDQDKEFLQWIMQDNPLDVDAAYRHSQPPASQQQQQQQQQQQYPAYPPSTIHQLSHQQKSPNYSEQQRLYDERFSHQQPHSNGSKISTQSQHVGPVPPPPQTYLSNETTTPQQQQMHRHPHPHQQQQQQQNHHQTYYAHHQHHHPYDLHQQQTQEPKSIPEARLSDEDEEHYTDAQLKMMTSKERRQLRNKISARNFRNRRKEYIASLEGEVAKFKNENSQLRLEIKWVRTTMNKLQKENDHLRVKLALCHGGIKTGEESVSPDQPSQETQQQQLQQSISSPPNATSTTMAPPAVSSLSPPPPGPTPSVQLSVQHAQQSHHVLPTTANANVSQKHSPSSSLNLPTQNGNSSHISPTLNGDSNYIHHHHQQQQTVYSQQQPHHHHHSHTSPPPISAVKQQSPSPPPVAATTNHQRPSSQSAIINQQQQQQHQPQKSMQQQSQTVPPNSGMSTASAFTTSPPQVMPGTIDTVHSDSSSSFTSHLSPPNFADMSDAWDLVISNDFSSYCPPPSGMTQQTAPLFVPNMSYATPDYHPSQPPNQRVLLPANVTIAQQHPQQQQYHLSQQQQQEQQHSYPANQTALYRPRNNDSYVSSAVVPDFNLENVLCKQNQPGSIMDNNLFKTYPLLIPALMSIVIGHTMSMSTDDLLSHTRLLSTPHHTQQNRRLAPTAMLHPFDGDHRQCLYFGNSKMMMMTPGLRSTKSPHNSPGPYPLSKKQVHAMWENLLDQMVKAKSKQRYRQQQQQQFSISSSVTTADDNSTTTTKASKAETRREIESEIAQEMMMSTMKWNSEHNNLGTTTSTSISSEGDSDDYYDDDEDDEEPWYDMPVTGFKAICPLYWMQRQFCRFVITYVVVKYPHLEDPCKTYLPICEQFRRRAITN